MTDNLPAHSPLGASSAERWSVCRGSVDLLRQWQPPPEEEEPEYRSDGTAAHEFAARALIEELESYELVGAKATNGTECSDEMADAISIYLDSVRSFSPRDAQHIEVRISSDRHRLFYGTADCVTIMGRTVVIHDYKHGVGVLVEAEANKQFLYYAYGVLKKLGFENFDKVVIVCVQPRAFKSNPVDVWEIEAEYVQLWGEEVLIPTMEAAEFDNALVAGEHCRFCPAKIVCPKQRGMFAAMAADDYSKPLDMNDDALAMEYAQIKIVKMRIKAIEDEVLHRLVKGGSLSTAKLVNSKTDRVWKDDAEQAVKEKLGEKSYTTPELKSPAQIERLGPDGKHLVAEYAYKPLGKPTVAPIDDARPAVKVKTAEETFREAIDAQAA
jgi:hypothetical protein